MAIVYVDSNASGANDGTSWADAHSIIANATFTWNVGDDPIYVAHNHAESAASHLISTNGTVVNPAIIIRVNSSTDIFDPTTLDGLGTVNLKSTSGDITFDDNVVLIGLSVEAYNDLNFASGANNLEAHQCYLHVGAQAAGTNIFRLSTSRSILIKDGYLKMGGSSYLRTQYSRLTRFINTPIEANSTSGALVWLATDDDSRVEFLDCDLSLIATTSLVKTSGLSATNSDNPKITFTNCELPANYARDNAGGAISAIISIELNGCSSAGVGYINERGSQIGSVETSTSAYYNDGYSDREGSTRLSQVLEPLARCSFWQPLASVPIVGIFDTLTSTSITVELVENFTAALTAKECWLELSYYDGASDTFHAIDNANREIIETSYTNLSAGAGLSSWTGEPAGSRSVKLTTTITPAKIGLYRAIVYLGKYESGKVVHVDPVLDVA